MVSFFFPSKIFENQPIITKGGSRIFSERWEDSQKRIKKLDWLCRLIKKEKLSSLNAPQSPYFEEKRSKKLVKSRYGNFLKNASFGSTYPLKVCIGAKDATGKFWGSVSETDMS